MTNENGRKTKRLSREILGLLLITAVIALFFWGFLYLTANSISETYFTERNLQPSEGQWLTLRAWIRSVSLLSTVILFLVLFLFLLGQKLAYLREIIQGVDALRTHRLEDTIPLREANELTELAEHINFLSETERRLRQQEMALHAADGNFILFGLYEPKGWVHRCGITGIFFAGTEEGSADEGHDRPPAGGQ